MKNVLQRANRIPPCLCRFLARKRRGTLPMTNTEIAHVAMISRALVAKLSKMKDWRNVTFGTAVKFSTACGVNLLSPCKQIRFLRRQALEYQRNGSAAQRRMFERIASDLMG